MIVVGEVLSDLEQCIDVDVSNFVDGTKYGVPRREPASEGAT
jgi:hypothetical protein